VSSFKLRFFALFWGLRAEISRTKAWQGHQTFVGRQAYIYSVSFWKYRP